MAHEFIKLHSKQNLVDTSPKYRHSKDSVWSFVYARMNQRQIQDADHIVIVTPRGTMVIKCRAGLCLNPEIGNEAERILHALQL